MHKTNEELRSIVLMYSNAGVTLSEQQIENVISTLSRLLSKCRQMKEPGYNDVKLLLAWTTSQIELILGVEELDDAVYEYGCINELYSEIMEYFNHPVESSEYELESDFVYWTEWRKKQKKGIENLKSSIIRI